jgi:hypothetical protein
MKRAFLLTPGIPAFLDVVALRDGDRFNHGVVYLSPLKGAVFGARDFPLDQSTFLPNQVKEAINKHFKTVFDLAHEEWKERTPSPRTVYCDSLQPWTIEVEEEDPS